MIFFQCHIQVRENMIITKAKSRPYGRWGAHSQRSSLIWVLFLSKVADDHETKILPNNSQCLLEFMVSLYLKKSKSRIHFSFQKTVIIIFFYWNCYGLFVILAAVYDISIFHLLLSEEIRSPPQNNVTNCSVSTLFVFLCPHQKTFLSVYFPIV